MTRIDRFWLMAILVVMCAHSIFALSTSSSGPWHSLEVRDGNVYSFGSNVYGQLGLENVSHLEQPTRIVGLTDIVGVRADRFYSLAVDSEGNLYGWGMNAHGEILPNGPKKVYSPVRMTSISSQANVTILEKAILIKEDNMFHMQGVDVLGLTGIKGTYVSLSDTISVAERIHLLNDNDREAAVEKPAEDANSLKQIIRKLQEEINSLKQQLASKGVHQQNPSSVDGQNITEIFGPGAYSIQTVNGNTIVTLR